VIILIADLAVVVAGLVCLVLTAVIPRFGETDWDRWGQVKQHAELGWQAYPYGFAAAVWLTFITCCCGPKYRPWAGLLAAIWIVLFVPMVVGRFMMDPLDTQTRHRIVFNEKAGLDHKKLAAECLKLRRSGIWGELPKSAWPSSIAQLHPSYVIFGEDGLTIELCGGFDHFGYKLEKSSDGKNWSWQWYTETEGGEELAKIPVDPKLDRK
jgi:hypothetical protein